MKTVLLTFDLEEFVVPKEYGLAVDEKTLFDISIKGLTDVIELLKKNNVTATFFTTKTFARNNNVQPLLRKLLKNGNELALHGNDHFERYAAMTSEQILATLKDAKDYLEHVFKTKIYGFRAPQLQHVPFTLLKKLDLRYEASLHPTFVPGRYNNFFSSRKPSIHDDVVQIPISVTPFVRLPLSWVWFRNLGLRYIKTCTFLNFLNSDYVHLYFHPWDFYDFRGTRFVKDIPLYFTRNSYKTSPMLNLYIPWLKRKKVTFKTINNYLKNYESTRLF